MRQYRAAFRKVPGVWGSFTYDSAKILFRAIDRARSYDLAPSSAGCARPCATAVRPGRSRSTAKTGYRAKVPVSILRVDSRKRFVIAR